MNSVRTGAPGRRRHAPALWAVAAVVAVAAGLASEAIERPLERLGFAPIRSAQAAQPSTAGRDLAASCTGCHNTDGRAIGMALPIAGLPADRMIQLMADFRDGKRPATVMNQISKGYTPDQVKLIADYLAAQAPKK